MQNRKKLIEKIQNALSDELLTADQLRLRTGIHVTEGHCAIAAEAVYHLLGGKKCFWKPMVLPRKILGNNTHWWIENTKTGERIDPTAEQFGSEIIPYHLGRGCGFQTIQPSKRARTVIKRVRNGN